MRWSPDVTCIRRLSIKLSFITQACFILFMQEFLVAGLVYRIYQCIKNDSAVVDRICLQIVLEAVTNVCTGCINTKINNVDPQQVMAV